MESILEEIEHALTANLFYLAVALSLTLPDICGALEASDGRAKPTRYRAWYNANLASKYKFLTEVDIYSLRCGVIHQGRFGHPNMQFDRVIFTIPNNGITIHNNLMKIGNPPIFALNLDSGVFCRDVIASVRNWFAANKHTSNVVANLPNLVQLRTQGLPPFIVGVPLIA